MQELIEYLKKQNAQRTAYITDDPTYWEAYGITTVDEYQKYEVACHIYEVYGILYDWDILSLEELKELRGIYEKI